MTRAGWSVVLAALLFALPLSTAGLVHGSGAPTDVCGDRLPHPSILISGDEGPSGFVVGHEPATGTPLYRPGTGILSGSGTPSDPYVIEGWCILGTWPSIGLLIQGTDDHVVVRDNVIIDHAEGIWLRSTSNVTLADNLVLDTHGVLLEGVRSILVHGNHIQGGVWGLLLQQDDGIPSRGNQLHHNTLTGNEDGIVVRGSHGNEIHDNTLTGNEDGIALSFADSNRIHNNTVTGSGLGLSLYGSDGNEILDNAVTSNTVGITVTDGLGPDPIANVVHGNNIWGNEEAGLTSAALPATSTDARANWWGCPDGPAHPGCDGLVTVGGGAVDHDPWLAAPNPMAGVGP